MEPCAVITG